MPENGFMRRFRLWLFAGWILVLTMLVIGGITRLTGSGLSIVQWKPVSGIIPPLSEAGWQEEFSAYKSSPEYKKINSNMTLAGFKKIFFWEYLHRLLGRFTGLFFISGLFLFRKKLYRSQYKSIITLVVLIGIQGLMGWLMVKSGLQDRPHVSHYRLALHLGLAFILGYFICKTYYKSLYMIPLSRTIPACIFIQVLLGALVAGLKAGLIANTWPLMDGSFFPAGYSAGSLWQFSEYGILVQFMHRWFPIAIVIALGITWIRNRTDASAVWQLSILAGLIAIQFFLGIYLLLFQVPTAPAVLHQAVAFIIFSYSVLMGKETLNTYLTKSGISTHTYIKELQVALSDN